MTQTLKNKFWWNGASLYQVYPRSFQDTQSNGIGDLRGVTERLDYIQSLGVQGLWLGPVFASPMRDFGYDVSDYKNLSPDYGSFDDFKELLKAAQERSLKVILDLVLNHTSDQHSWFQASIHEPQGPYGDFYVWADGSEEQAPNNWLSAFGGSAWTWNEKRQQYYYHHFLREQPDLNFHNPRVQDELLAIADFWLALGVDGFRLDACNCYFHDQHLRDNPLLKRSRGDVQDEANPYVTQDHIYDKSQPQTPDFLHKLRELCDSYGECFLIGEIFCDREQQTLAEYTQGGRPLHSAYNFSLLKNHRPQGLFHTQVKNFWNLCPETTWALSNHDVTRVVSRWQDSLTTKKRAEAYLNLLSALPGTIIIYQGEELGLPEASVEPKNRKDPFGKNIDSSYPGRDGCRTPMPWSSQGPFMGFSEAEPWLPLSEEHRALAVSEQDQQQGSTLNMARRSLRWRRHNGSLICGAIEFVQDDQDGIAFYRRDLEDGDLLVISSFSEVEIKMPIHVGAQIISGLSQGLRIDSSGYLNVIPGGYGRVIWEGTS